MAEVRLVLSQEAVSSTCLFVYFGLTKFVWLEKEMEVYDYDSNSISLSDLTETKETVSDDIQKLRSAKFNQNGSWSIAVKFVKVSQESNVWIYKHGAYVKCHSAEYSSFLPSTQLTLQVTKNHFMMLK